MPFLRSGGDAITGERFKVRGDLPPYCFFESSTGYSIANTNQSFEKPNPPSTIAYTPDLFFGVIFLPACLSLKGFAAGVLSVCAW